ncbi:hypothetical protein LCGC14_1972070, partial [marine sediment metagenome]
VTYNTDTLINAGLSAPFASIRVCEKTQASDSSSAQAQIVGAVIKINEDADLLSASNITIPAQTITLATAQANVTHTMK